ncbi:hypothetical protein M0R45_016463 [Rubus argutus]|uniref:RNA-directed RNA polymerase n=1 Tax=Rubus argutus TaxID=59490 RepID=A0AAW1XU01_RUBAR
MLSQTKILVSEKRVKLGVGAIELIGNRPVQNSNLMRNGWDEQEQVRLPQSVEVLLGKICADKKQPWPDGDVRRELASLSEESALETLQKISDSTRSIRTLGGYIKWMIRQCSSSSPSPSPSKTVRSTAHIQTPSSPTTPVTTHLSHPAEAFTVPRQPGNNQSPYYSSRSPLKAPHTSPVQPDERFQGDVCSDRSPVGQSPYSIGSSLKAASTSYQRVSSPVRLDERFQAEAFTVLEQSGNNNNKNGQSPYYTTGSPRKAARTSYQSSSASLASVQDDERFQGEAFRNRSPVIGQSPYFSGSPFKATGTSSYPRLSAPEQLDERFQGDVFSDQSPVGQLPFSSGSPLKGAGTSHQRRSPPVQLDERFQGEAFRDRSPVIGQSPYSSGSPFKAAGTSYQRLCAPEQLDERFQGDVFSDRSPVGQIPYSTGSQLKAACTCHQRLSPPVQLDERFQGEPFRDRSPAIGQSPYSSGSPFKAAGSSYQRISAPEQLDERFQGEVFSDRSPGGQLPYSSGSPLKAAGTCHQSLSPPVQLDERFQGEAFGDRSPVIGQSPYSSGSPFKAAGNSYQRLSAPSQLDERFQGEAFTDRTPVHRQSPYASGSQSKNVCTFPCQRMSADVAPVQLHERFQGEVFTRSSVLDKPGDHGEAHLVALGELDFRKQFLILSYAGGKKLKDLIAAEDIRHWKNLPMVMFESKVWEYLGRKCISTEDRRLSFDWDCGSTHVYHCYVSVDGSYRFKGPYLYKLKRTLLQKELGDDNVLLVKFAKEVTQRGHSTYDHNYATYMKVAREGIVVGLRRYHFFVFKDGGNEEKKKKPSFIPCEVFFCSCGF